MIPVLKIQYQQIPNTGIENKSVFCKPYLVVVVPTSSSVSFCLITSNLVEGIQLAIAKEKMQPKMTSMTAISMLLSWKTQVRSYYIYVEDPNWLLLFKMQDNTLLYFGPLLWQTFLRVFLQSTEGSSFKTFLRVLLDWNIQSC